jgi:hypothetical protein
MKLDAQIVGRVVSELRVGKANAVPGHVLASRLGITRLRTIGEAVKFERARRYRSREPQIASDGSGYWIVESAAELLKPQRALRRRGFGIFETAQWLDPDLFRFLEQQGVLEFMRRGAA